MLATDAVFTMTVGNVYRYRPYLYGTEGGSGRAAKLPPTRFLPATRPTRPRPPFSPPRSTTTSTPTPGPALRVGAAALVPAAVAYNRIEAGKHFLTDNLVGYAVGATMGILVPQLHKKAGRRPIPACPCRA